MDNSKGVLFHLLTLVGHVPHILEETRGRFWPIDACYELGWFLVANWVLLCIPVVFFYFVLHEKRGAYYMSIIYAGIMILNDVEHNMATIVTRRYFDGCASGYTGIGLLLIEPPMIYYLRKTMPTN